LTVKRKNKTRKKESTRKEEKMGTGTGKTKPKRVSKTQKKTA